MMKNRPRVSPTPTMGKTLKTLESEALPNNLPQSQIKTRMTDDGPIFYEKLSSREYTPIERFRRASLKVFAGALGPPLSFVWSSLPKHLVFMNKDGNVTNDFFSDPLKSFGIDSENLQISSSSGNILGLWAVKREFSIGSILFCHGSGGNRASPSHRLAILKNLSALNFNIVAFDYSGFGDSSGTPNCANVVEDTVSAYKFMTTHFIGPYLIYGHSLGTSIAVEAVACLQNDENPVDGLICDSCLPSMRREMLEFPTVQLSRSIYSDRLFERFVDHHIQKSGLNFTTDSTIIKVTCPILLFHSKNDTVIKWEHAQNHFKAICVEGASNWCRFILFEDIHNYGHCGNIYYPGLPSIMTEFINAIKFSIQRYQADVL
ncbi:unnamed protein product [Oikopleura dioica]|uniref:AB hydrolase-1 domain-containing protein n=1 Tax=Oikopleura dioica TaxID=34765 RepID=E4YV00_OIKDI|nr:unnamed protein product [Oikopleura dioica]